MKKKIKMKTPSVCKRRIKITGTGLALAMPCGRRHGMNKRNSRRWLQKRSLHVINLPKRIWAKIGGK